MIFNEGNVAVGFHSKARLFSGVIEKYHYKKSYKALLNFKWLKEYDKKCRRR